MALIAVLIVTMISIAGCSKNIDAPEPQSPVLLGVIAPLTGPNAWIGDFIVPTIEMSIGQINEAGGINGASLKMVLEDAGSSQAASTAAAKLIEQDGVSAIYAVTTPVVAAASAVAEQRKTPLFGFTAVNTFAKKNNYVFSDLRTNSVECAELARIADRNDDTRVAFLGNDVDFSVECKDALKATMRKGIIVADEMKISSVPDAKTQLTKIQQADPDAMVLVCWPPDCNIIYKQMLELGVLPRLYLPIAQPLPANPIAVAGIDTGTVFKNAIGTDAGLDPEDPTPAFKRFFDDFKAFKGKEPAHAADAAVAADNVQMLAIAMRKCPELDGDCIRDRLAETDYDGYGGRVAYNGQHTAVRSIRAITFKDGKWVNFEEAAEPQTEVVKIGVSEPLTGSTAFIGQRIKNGINLAYGELSPEEQQRIELVYEDDGCNGKQGVTAVQKLASVDKVDYLIGPTCNAAAIPTINLLREAGVVYLSTGVIGEQFAAAGDHHFALQPRIKDLMYKLADYAYNAKGARRISIFFLNDEFGQESAAHFENRFTSLGGEIVARENFAPSDTDFRTQISKLKGVPVDGIFLMSYGTWLVNQLKQMDELGLQTQFYGPVPIQDSKLVSAAGKLAEGIIYPYADEYSKTEPMILFEQTYKAAYGTEADNIYPAVGYDSFRVLLDVIEQCGRDRACAKDRLKQLQNYQGALGTVSLDEDGVGKRNLVIKQIKDGKFGFAEITG